MRLFRIVTVSIGLWAMAAVAVADESAVVKPSTQSVEALWERVGDFCGIGSWHPGVAKCQLSADKRTRTLTLKDGGTLVEHLVKWNDETHSYTYTIVAGSWPLTNYAATLEVAPAESGAGAVLHWNSHYTPRSATDSNAKTLVEDFYRAGLAGLGGN